jgi:hypothetical protein
MSKIHKDYVNYEGSLDELVEEIGDLRYDVLEEFLNKLSNKLREDALTDCKRGRVQLAYHLNSAHYFTKFAKEQIKEAWRISKPYMGQ